MGRFFILISIAVLGLMSVFGTLAPGAADQYTVSNCTNQALQIRTFLDYDVACWVPYQTHTASACGSVDFFCSTKCKISTTSELNCGHGLLDSNQYVYTVLKNLRKKGELLGAGAEEWDSACECDRYGMKW